METMLKYLKRTTFFDDEPSGGGAAADAPPDSTGAAPPAAAGSQPASAAPAPAAAADAPAAGGVPPAGGLPDLVSTGLWGPPPEHRGASRQEGPPPERGGPPAGERRRGITLDIDDPGEPSQELWEEDFRRAQAQNNQHIQAQTAKAVAQQFERELETRDREIESLRGGFTGDREGRLLTAMQSADRTLRSEVYDQAHGLVATNPHYQSNPEVKKGVDTLIAMNLNNAVRYAAETGRLEEITRATSRDSIECSLLLGLYYAGADFSQYGIGRGRKPTARVAGGDLPESRADHGGGRKPLSDEAREIWKTTYAHMTEDEFRKHFEGKL